MRAENRTFAPPLTLAPKERAILDRWPWQARRRFELLAGEMEFLQGRKTAEAEAQAFESVTRELAEGKHQ